MEKKVGKGKIKISKDSFLREGVGFTLWELTIVLFLLGFILLLTFPNFRDLLFFPDIKRGVLSLVGAIKYAQSQAATTKQIHRLMIDVRDNTFWLLREEEKGKFMRDPSLYGQPRSLPGGIIFWDVIHPEQGQVTKGEAHIDFYPTGWAEEGTVHLKRKEEEFFTIFINPLGGRVEISEGYLQRKKG
ncbi:MAG: hypothetical protein ACUVWV_12245 [Thermodesulfobacteriota bacterium]